MFDDRGAIKERPDQRAPPSEAVAGAEALVRRDAVPSDAQPKPAWCLDRSQELNAVASRILEKDFCRQCDAFLKRGFVARADLDCGEFVDHVHRPPMHPGTAIPDSGFHRELRP